DDGRGALTYEQQADDLIAVLDAETVERADVFGHSDGGILALELGTRHPDRVGKIVASGPNLRPDTTALYDWAVDSTRSGLAQATAMFAAHDTTRDWVRRKRQLDLDLNEPHLSLD